MVLFTMGGSGDSESAEVNAVLIQLGIEPTEKNDKAHMNNKSHANSREQ